MFSNIPFHTTLIKIKKPLSPFDSRSADIRSDGQDTFICAVIRQLIQPSKISWRKNGVRYIIAPVMGSLILTFVSKKTHSISITNFFLLMTFRGNYYVLRDTNVLHKQIQRHNAAALNPLNMKRRLLYLKTQFVPRCCAMY